MTEDEYTEIHRRVRAWAVKSKSLNWWHQFGEDALQQAFTRHISSGRPLPQPKPVSYFISATWRNAERLMKETTATGVHYSDSIELEFCFTEDDEPKVDLRIPKVPGLTELTLKVVHGMSHRQIARHLGITESNSANRVNRAKKHVRRHYECNPRSTPC